jgi:hypothetical protein
VTAAVLAALVLTGCHGAAPPSGDPIAGVESAVAAVEHDVDADADAGG